MRSHEWIDQRSRAFDLRIAEKLEAEPGLLQKPVQVLERWIDQRQPDPPAVLLEWQKILRESSLAQVLTLLRSDSDFARRLRQSSPFCGLLSAEERLVIFREYEAARA